MERFLRAHGRRLLGWDEILTPELLRTAIVMSWRGIDGAVQAAMRGKHTALAPSPTLYFDHRQSAALDEPPGRAAVISLEDVYRFEPRPGALSEAAAAHVLGVEASVWTEQLRTDERGPRMSF